MLIVFVHCSSEHDHLYSYSLVQQFLPRTLSSNLFLALSHTEWSIQSDVAYTRKRVF